MDPAVQQLRYATKRELLTFGTEYSDLPCKDQEIWALEPDDICDFQMAHLWYRKDNGDRVYGFKFCNEKLIGEKPPRKNRGFLFFVLPHGIEP